MVRVSVLLSACHCANVSETEAPTLTVQSSSPNANPQEMQFVAGMEALIRLVMEELFVSSHSQLGEPPGKHQMTTTKMSKKQGSEWCLNNAHKSKTTSDTHQFKARNSVWAVVGILHASIGRLVFWPESLSIMRTFWLSNHRYSIAPSSLTWRNRFGAESGAGILGSDIELKPGAFVGVVGAEVRPGIILHSFYERLWPEQEA